MRGLLAEDGNLAVVDFGGPGPLLSKRQLAQHPAINRSTRWVELRVAEGMPSRLDGNKRMFSLPEVEEWLAGQRRRANG